MGKSNLVGRIIFWCLMAACPGAARGETRVLFTSNTQTPNGTHELYSMTAQGSNIVRLTHNEVTEWGPALAPDGYRIAYVATNQAASNLFLTDLHGDIAVPVGNTNEALAVQWGDSNVLYYLAREAGVPPTQKYSLWKIGADGSAQARVYTNVFETWPLGAMTFSVDRISQRVYLPTFSPPSGYSLVISGGLGALGPDAVMPGAPAFRDHYNPSVVPGTAQLAFSADQTASAGSHRLYVGSMAGGTPLQVCDTFCGSPAWSSDGSWLAFARAPVSTLGMQAYLGDLWRVGTNGTGLVNLTTNTAVQGGCGFPTVYEEVEPRITFFPRVGNMEWESGLANPLFRVQESIALDHGWTSCWLTATSLSATVDVPGSTARAFRRLRGSRADLLAWYPLTNDYLDQTRNYGPLSYSNAPFAGGGVYCNGIAPNLDPMNGCKLEAWLPTGFDFSNLAFSVQFLVTNAPSTQRPVIMGGASWRWAGVYLNPAGQVGLCISNAYWFWGGVTFQTSVWHETTLVYDGAAQTCEVYLDGVGVVTHLGPLVHGFDPSFAVAHYGNSETFQGYLRHLRIYRLR